MASIPQRFMRQDRSISWPEITVPEKTSVPEFGTREEGSIEIPFDFKGKLSLWAVPKCKRYPEGYCAIFDNGAYYHELEPGFEDWRKILLFRVQYDEDIDDRYFDTNESYERGGRAHVSFKADCIKDVLDESNVSPDPIEIAYLEYDETVTANANEDTPFKMVFHGSVEGEINVVIETTAGSITIGDTIITPEQQATVSGTIDALNSLLASAKINTDTTTTVTIEYDPEQSFSSVVTVSSPEITED